MKQGRIIMQISNRRKRDCGIYTKIRYEDAPRAIRPAQASPDPTITLGGGLGITEGEAASFTITASPAPASPIMVKAGVSQSGDFGASGATTAQVSGATTSARCVSNALGP